jgi:hypothetical protein
MLVETPESQAAHHQPAVPGSESGADRFLAAIDWLQAVAPLRLRAWRMQPCCTGFPRAA